MLHVEAIAVIGKNNNPLYISCLDNLKYHFVAHTAIDVMEERTAQKQHDMYLGLLMTLEDLAVFGYMTSSKIKFVLMISVQDVSIKDQDVKNVLGLI